jgi:hypothetical protein
MYGASLDAYDCETTTSSSVAGWRLVRLTSASMTFAASTSALNGASAPPPEFSDRRAKRKNDQRITHEKIRFA